VPLPPVTVTLPVPIEGSCSRAYCTLVVPPLAGALKSIELVLSSPKSSWYLPDVPVTEICCTSSVVP
jgi:hypothetical protein